MAQYGYASHGWQHVAKQFDAFSNQHSRHQRHAGNVPARTRQAGNYAGFDRVARDYDDWNFSCCLLRRQRAGDVERHDHIDLKPDQLGRKLGKSIQLSFRGAKLECNVLPFHIAKFTQSFPEFLFEQLRVRESLCRARLFEPPWIVARAPRAATPPPHRRAA